MWENLFYYILLILIFYYIYIKISNIETFDNSNIDPLKIMSNYNVIFVGTIRNVEKYLLNTLENIDKCGKKFKDYCLIVYENDSFDNTRNILINNKKENYHYIFEDNILEPRRTMRISNGRNKILDKINEININNYYTYMINLDMDNINESGTFVNSIETCFKYDVESWDVLTGNQSSTYYDLWALRKTNILEVDLWTNKNNNEDLFKLKFEQNGLLEIDSAFGGIAIYKLSSIPNKCRYNGEYMNNNKENIPQGTEKCEHVDFNECIKENNGKLFINTDFLTY
jgi:hypothetical protein